MLSTTIDLADFVTEPVDGSWAEVAMAAPGKAAMDGDIPGDTTTTATLTLGDTVTGEWETSDDEDWYGFSVEAGDIAGFQLDTAAYTLILYSGDGTALASSVDDILTYQFADAGTYFISALGSLETYRLNSVDVDDDYAGDSSTTGQLRVGGSSTSGVINFSGDRDWFAFTIAPDTAVEIVLQDGSFSEFFTLTVFDTDGNAVARGEDAFVVGDIAAGDYFLQVEYSDVVGGYSIRSDAITDTNIGSTATTASIAVGGEATGTIDFEGDRDWFAFSVDGTETLTLFVEGADTVEVDIYDAAGNFVRSGSSFADTEGLAAGDYFASVGGFFMDDFVRSYTLSLEGEVVDDFAGDQSSTGELTLATPTTGVIDFEGDTDWFLFSAVQGTHYRVEITSGDASVTGAFRTNGDDAPSVDIVDGVAFLPSFGARFFLEISGTLGAEYTLVATPAGTDGRDDYRGTDGDDLYDALGGNDRLIAGDGNDTIYGGAGNDVFVDGAGDDLYHGGAGNDAFISGPGADLFSGGTGRDRVLYSRSESGLDVNLIDNSLNTGEAAGDVLVDIEVVIGSAFDDVLVSGNDAHDLFGGAGNDSLLGAGGNDRLFGGAGDDLILGGRGDDVLRGDAGNDVFSVREGEGRDRVLDFTQGEDTILFTGGPESLADLTVTTNAAGTVVTSGIGAIVLIGFFGTLVESDFRFRTPDSAQTAEANTKLADDLLVDDLSADPLSGDASDAGSVAKALGLTMVGDTAVDLGESLWADAFLDAMAF